MAVLSPQSTSRSGLNLTSNGQGAGINGDSWVNDGTSILWISNGAGSQITLTLKFGTGGTIDGQAPVNRTVTVPANTSMLVGPFPSNVYNDAGGSMNVTYSSTTSVSVLLVVPGS